MALPAIQSRTETRSSYGVLRGLPEGRVTPEQEAAFLDAGDRDGLVLHSLWEAFLYARECSRGRDGDGPILSACYAALQKSIRRFDRTFGVRYFAYSKPFIRGELKLERRRLRVVRPGKTTEDPHDFVNFEEWRRYAAFPNESEGDAEHPIPPAARVQNRAAVPKVGFELEVSADVDAGDRRALWKGFFELAEAHLSKRAVTVIRLHLEEGLGWQEIADRVGFTREAQRALFSESIARLASVSGRFQALLRYEHLRG